MFSVAKVRHDFPILSQKVHGKRLAYLDNAATSQKPKAVIEAISRYYRRDNANVHRGLHQLSERASEAYEQAREKVAGFIGARADELVFVRNATEGLNLVAQAWGQNNLKRGDEIVSTIVEHHSNLIPWQRLAKSKGAKLKLAGVDKNGCLKIDELKRLITKKTKIVALTHMSNTTGEIMPVEEIVKIAHKVGAVVVIDAAQSTPHLPVDVNKLKCDFLVLSGHKMLGPMGIGAVYLNLKLQKEMEPYMVGGGMISRVEPQTASWAAGVDKWEAGTPNVEGAIGLAAAVDYLQRLGMVNVRKHEQLLAKYALKKIAQVKWLRIIGPLDTTRRGGVITFVAKNVHAHDVAQILDHEGVAVRSGHHCTMPLHLRLGLVSTTRASVYIYNDKDDIDQLIRALKKVEEVLM
jgi:cysteine desulfurase/selenocysteine lyase